MPETVQFTDDYVVHGRGFTVGEDAWYDEYALHFGHDRFWNTQIADSSDWPEYDDWRDIDEWADDPTIYWSVTGAQTFIVQHPRVDTVSDEWWSLLYQLLDDVDWPDSAAVRMRVGPGSGDSHTETLARGDRTRSILASRLRECIETHK